MSFELNCPRGAMIISCSCKSDYQDRAFGKGKRVHNPINKNKGGEMYRCTICKRENKAP